MAASTRRAVITAVSSSLALSLSPSSPLPPFTREDLALPPEELPSDSLLSGLLRSGVKLVVVPPAKNAERVSSSASTLLVTVVCSSSEAWLAVPVH
ncbi:unnamed protein product [Danaus chrysippus]|uniref:(African queen) hypothetical protein n=1 Tax=Danaus chrysippus TaxID=151541 RepID=A0A8J2VRI5_9NEOP|nr:unnamed protein product [Danaus chrysippus]